MVDRGEVGANGSSKMVSRCARRVLIGGSTVVSEQR